MSEYNKILQAISALAILIPIFAGVLKFKIAGTPFRLFLLFLVIGLTTDTVMYYLAYLGNRKYLFTILNLYSLIESVFFFWMLAWTARSNLLRILSRSSAVIFAFFWFLAIVLFPLMGWPGNLGEWFDALYEIVVAFLSGFTLLQLVEKEESVFSLPQFWIALGIFFYCFCTFFIMGFLNTIVSHWIWFMNNTINILTYLFYAWGLYSIQRGNGLNQTGHNA